MKPCLILWNVLFVSAIGCSGDDNLPPRERMETYVTVIDEAGTEREIPSSSLVDEDTGKPAAKRIFVVDRQSNQKKFVAVSEWQAQSPSQMRYVPVAKQKK